MPISATTLAMLQDRYKQLNKTKLTTQQDANAGVDPTQPANQLQPRNSAYLSSDYDQNPIDQGKDNADNQTGQIQSIAALSNAANEATATAAQFQTAQNALKEQARQGAISRRQSEMGSYINGLKAANPLVNIQSKIDAGSFSKSTSYVPGTNVSWDMMFKALGMNASSGASNAAGSVKGQGVNSGVDAQRQKVLQAAQNQLGVLYQWGGGGKGGPSHGDTSHGTDRVGFDCSGLSEYAFGKLGWSIGTWTGDQAPWAMRHGKAVPKSKLVPGDIVFGGGSPGNLDAIHHVAIYWGNGKIIEAPQTWVNGSPGKVRISPMRAGQWGIHLNY